MPLGSLLKSNTQVPPNRCWLNCSGAGAEASADWSNPQVTAVCPQGREPPLPGTGQEGRHWGGLICHWKVSVDPSVFSVNQEKGHEGRAKMRKRRWALRREEKWQNGHSKSRGVKPVKDRLTTQRPSKPIWGVWLQIWSCTKRFTLASIGCTRAGRGVGFKEGCVSPS